MFEKFRWPSKMQVAADTILDRQCDGVPAELPEDTIGNGSRNRMGVSLTPIKRRSRGPLWPRERPLHPRCSKTKRNMDREQPLVAEDAQEEEPPAGQLTFNTMQMQSRWSSCVREVPRGEAPDIVESWRSNLHLPWTIYYHRGQECAKADWMHRWRRVSYMEILACRTSNPDGKRWSFFGRDPDEGRVADQQLHALRRRDKDQPMQILDGDFGSSGRGRGYYYGLNRASKHHCLFPFQRREWLQAWMEMRTAPCGKFIALSRKRRSETAHGEPWGNDGSGVVIRLRWGFQTMVIHGDYANA